MNISVFCGYLKELDVGDDIKRNVREEVIDRIYLEVKGIFY